MMNRRSFLGAATLAATAGMLPAATAAQAAPRRTSTPVDVPTNLIDLHAHIPHPVVIRSIDLLRADGVLFIRSVAEDGTAGVSIGNVRMPNLVSILEGLVIPNFVGKDARDLEALVVSAHQSGRNYKYAGLALSSPIGQVEWSLFDLLGRVAGVPASTFFGPTIRTSIPVYISTFDRESSPEEAVGAIVPILERTSARAVKIKIGGRMHVPDLVPGRTDAIIPHARKTLGDDVVLFADGNSSWDVARGIEVGRMLEANGYSIFEEPVWWEDFAGTKAVADALEMTVAGGEQDTSLPKWQWIVENRALDLLQPDLVYNGGFIRAMQVARMAEQAGLPVSPHAPAMGPEAAMKFQFAAVAPNLGTYQEHREEQDTRAWYEPKFYIEDGRVEIPTGPGLGVDYDPDLWTRAERVTCGG